MAMRGRRAVIERQLAVPNSRASYLKNIWYEISPPL
jgi:hypothetical protein